MSEIAHGTLSLLEQRLNRLEFLLSPNGEDIDAQAHNMPDVKSRVNTLERKLSELESVSPTIHEILKLYAKHPTLFNNTTEKGDHIPPSRLDATSIVLSATPAFHATVSQLNNLQNATIPNISSLIPLLELQNRVITAQQTQESQVRELEELREKSATIAAQWYQESILTAGTNWLELENRMMKLEQSIRRREASKERTENEI